MADGAGKLAQKVERDARERARLVLRHLLGSAPQRLSALSGGLTNHVFAARCAGEDLVVRLNDDPAKLKDYLKEQWAMARANEQDVPTPEVLEVGIEPVGVPYMVSRRVAGAAAVDHPARRETLRALGALARRIHAVPTVGFGSTFDWSNNRLSKNDTWNEYLTRELCGAQRLDALERHGMLTPAAAKALRRALKRLAALKPAPALNHGDLRLKNVVVDAAGAITAVLDWECCTSHVAPYWDLSIALHDLSVDAKEAFVEGYGAGADALLEAAPILRVFNALNYAPEVEAAAAAKDRTALERFRMRLHGALDLYAF